MKAHRYYLADDLKALQKLSIEKWYESIHSFPLLICKRKSLLQINKTS